MAEDRWDSELEQIVRRIDLLENRLDDRCEGIERRIQTLDERLSWHSRNHHGPGTTTRNAAGVAAIASGVMAAVLAIWKALSEAGVLPGLP